MRTLGVYIALSLKWYKQYEIMKEKIRGAVAKLRNTSIHPS